MVEPLNYKISYSNEQKDKYRQVIRRLEGEYIRFKYQNECRKYIWLTYLALMVKPFKLYEKIKMPLISCQDVGSDVIRHGR